VLLWLRKLHRLQSIGLLGLFGVILLIAGDFTARIIGAVMIVWALVLVVLWRKKSFGAQSERGHLFAERIMTVAHTSRKQKRSVLSFLTETCRARVERRPLPSLFTA